MITSDNKYTKMQLDSYEKAASYWNLNNRNPVVGSYDAHNQWDDYDLLFDKVDNKKEKVVLDFACGPGRNIIKFKELFKRIDGVDLSSTNIENAKLNIQYNNIEIPNLYVNNGVDLSCIDSNTYDIVMSTIALQHICVHSIRQNIFTEIYRVLKPGGLLTAQMGYGYPSRDTVGYYEDYYDAHDTNRSCDVCIESPDQLKQDLEDIGFKSFSFKITNVGPGDYHPNWIYFKVIK